MSIKKIEGYLNGFVNIHVEGYFIERFINMCRIQKIYLWNIEKKNNIYLTVNIGLKDFKKIRKIAKKTKCKVGIDRKKGVPFFLHKYKKRKFFLAMFLIIILALFILSKFIWNIEINITGDDLTEDEILSSLNENGLYIGERKRYIDIKENVNNIIGHKKENILKLKEYYDVDVRVEADDDIKPGKFKLEIEKTYQDFLNNK